MYKLRDFKWRASVAALVLAVPALADSPADDPYLWLEKLDSPESMQWVHAENDKTLSVLEKDSHFDKFYQDALSIAQAKDRIPMPSVMGGEVFNFWQDADHVKGIWRKTDLKSYATSQPKWSTVLDLDAISSQEKANWVQKNIHCEQVHERRCLIELSDGGEDAVTSREFDLKTGQFVTNGFSLPHGKPRTTWQDENTLLIAQEWKAGELTTSGYPFVVKRLKRGQALADAQEIFRGEASDGGYGVSPYSFRDATGHQALIIDRPLSTFESEYYLVGKSGVAKLAMPLKAKVEGLFQGQLLIRLDQDWAATGKTFAQGSLVSVDLKAALAHPDQLKPALIYAPKERESLDGVVTTRDAVIVGTLNNVRGRAAIYQPKADGSWTSKQLDLPDNATVSLVDSSWHNNTVFFNVTSFLIPTSLWQLDAKTGKVWQVKALEAKFDASNEEVHQYEATSKDGTKVPYFVVSPKNMKLDGNNPTILNAYGGFMSSETPFYSGINGKLWLERGGVFVLANIRGGGEFGPAWHEAGLKTHRQVIYDDFAAVAQDLVARKITSTAKLGIMGGSNGGLLMGVELTQHPDYWSAVDIQVPLLDMLRFEQVAAGPSWVGEYGSVSNPDERAFLASISPYANLKRDVKYPQPLVWTTTKDDRVGPQHARKFAARLAEYGIPYYFYEVTEGGHGAGANLKETAHTKALEMTYFTRKLMDN